MGLVVTLTLASAVNAQGGDPYLATISIERAAAAKSPLGQSVELAFHVTDPEFAAVLLSNVDGLHVTSVDETSVQLVSIEEPTSSTEPDEKFTRSSFVIDFDEPSVVTLQKEFKKQHDGSPTMQEIVRFVYDHIEDKSYLRTFDFASKVAETRAGDCTEHAVLLAALARAQGYYARVVVGTLIVELNEDLRAYGHAWTEIHNGSKWQIADATMPSRGLELAQIRYLPVSTLDNEGPGYAFGMFEIMNAMPSKITGVSNRDEFKPLMSPLNDNIE